MYANNTAKEAVEAHGASGNLCHPAGSIEECIEGWMREADEYSQRGIAAECANTLRRCAKELAVARRADEEREVSLSEASKLCGYSSDHLGSLIRSGALTNYGRTGAPRLRVSQLPRKPGGLTRRESNANMRAHIARRIAHSTMERSDA